MGDHRRPSLLEEFNKWDQSDRMSFYVSQWKFLAPVFAKDELEYNLHQMCVLPITERGSEPAGEGYFSEVLKVCIRAEHQQVIETVRFHSLLAQSLL